MNNRENESSRVSAPASPPIPNIVSHPPSPAPPGNIQLPAAGPTFQGSPRPGECLAITPTMFPLTQTIYGSTPQPPVGQAVVPDNICPTPDPVSMSRRLNEKIHTPMVSPLPTPTMSSDPPRLTEADAEVIDIWFFRDKEPPRVEKDPDPFLVKWTLLKQMGNDLIPLSPFNSG
eukprot:Gregarina_sp_Poly_1__446@NODE_1108_length_5078_cov_259_161046_g768_i0_p3_GENE_NODE_1108_length_5078_cov_259_161046_g768_i0NODE_1108_length_5078_cov_259_161046_g768_i0_p3_ORF_typecomplete_len174_score20_61_NODE_1108_length_5078_cov_259_161046_g768_i037334254